jgi:predicted Zn-dependent protease
MAGDFELERGVQFGSWIRAELHEGCVVETEGWAPERVTRVAERLQADRPSADRLKVDVLWIDPIIAFTFPGDYVYFGRRMLERCPDDETAAFVIAHEIAHHDLGHLTLFPHWMGRAARRAGGQLLVFAIEAIERRLYGPERECQADAYGIDLCIRAGYDPERCLRWFPIMEQVALDLGDRDIVYGPDAESDEELSPNAPRLTKVKIWAWQRTRGYLPLQDRLEALRHHVAGQAGIVGGPA